MNMSPILLRSIERILNILVGALAIYLGYLLFLHIPNQMDSQGQVILPGGISIYLSRVGPGAFLALFGAIVVGLSFRYSIQYMQGQETVQPIGDIDQVESVMAEKSYSAYSGAVQVVSAADQRNIKIERYSLHSELFSQLSTLLKASATGEETGEVEQLIAKIKTALMEKVWADDWGNYTDFQVWVLNGAQEPAPNELRAAAAYYLMKEEGG